MGTVFKAGDTRLGVDVVVKVPHPMMIKDAEFAARFNREINSLVRMSHPNIVKVMDVGEHEGMPFVVMQYLGGGSLEDRIRPCTSGDVANWLPDAAAALDFMHSEGLIHRDIKPGNILFDMSGRAYLGDFGIAKVMAEGDESDEKLTGTGSMIGTAEYMAPEMLVPSRFDEAYNERSDQYSLAVTVYEMLSGRPPFQGKTMGDVIAQLVAETATALDERNPAIPQDVSRVVARALRKKPEGRFESCREFAVSFVAAVGGEPLPPSGGDRPAKRESSASGTVPRQPTQVEAPGSPEKRRTVTIQEPVPGPSRRPTMPESVASPDLPETKTGLGETEQQKPEVVGGDAAGGSVNRRKLVGGFLVIAFLLVVSVVKFMGSSSESVLGDSDSDATGPLTGRSVGPAIANSIGMKLRLIPAGDFLMGSPTTEPGRSYDEFQHRVTLTKPFYMGETEVTQAEYQQVMGTNPSSFKGPQNPVERVSWDDAMEFCRKLSGLPAEKAAGYEYRLPTEAEWEYACRAGTTTSYSCGDSASQLSEYGWFGGISSSFTHPVGEKKPNAWGLYDMHGNVWEWCQDRYGAYPSGSATDPTGASSSSYRVGRGGSWFNDAGDCRSAIRSRHTPELRYDNLGFRVLRSSIK
jgi:formylglycine-generating enzyme required for sulfatase activity/tRNA A-37 threonylcarbamoyl transferase component Bud32